MIVEVEVLATSFAERPEGLCLPAGVALIFTDNMAIVVPKRQLQQQLSSAAVTSKYVRSITTGEAASFSPEDV